MSIIIDGKSLRDHIKHLRRQTFLLNKKVKNLSSASTGTSSSLMAAPTSLGANIAISSIPHKDEDDMASNSVAHLATQQSIKAYADTKLPLAGGTLSGTLTVGVDDTGYDVKFFGATAGRYLLWDESDDALEFADDVRAKFGAGEDLQIYHGTVSGSTQSWIRDIGTNDLILDTNGTQIALISDGVVNDGKMALFKKDGAVELYYDNSKKFETTNTGISIPSGEDVTMGGTTKLIYETALQIYRDGNSAYLKALNGDINLINNDGDKIIRLNSNTAELYYNDNKKLHTTSAGATVTGALTVTTDIDVDGTTNLDAVDIDGNVQLDGTFTVGVDDTGHDVKFFGATSGKYMLWDESADSLKLTDTTNLDAGTGLRLYTDANGHAVIYALGQNKDLYLVGDDGGTGINALVFDMSDHGKASFNGQVNIGNPGYTSSNPDGYMKGAGNNGTAGSRFQVTANSSDNTRRLWLGTSHTEAAITITEDKVGIGTTTLIPAATKLHLFDSAPELRIQDGGDKASNASGYLSFYDHDSLMMNFGVNDGGAAELNLVNNAAFTFKTNNSVALTLNASQNATFAGNIRTGTSTLTANTNFDNLVIEGSAHTGITIFSGTSSDGGIYFGDSDANNLGQIKYLHGSNAMTFTTNDGAASLTLDSGLNATFAGNVGIGGTPSYELDVNKSEAGGLVDARVYNSENSNAASGSRLITAVNGANAGDPRLVLSVTAVQEYHVGIDNSDSDKFVIGTGSTPGSGTLFDMTTAGNATFAGTVICNNIATDKKIRFNRTGGNTFSIEHDSSQIYFYNETTGGVPFRISNASNATFQGTVSHAGLDIADGTGAQIDTKETFDLNLDFVANTWIDTGIYSNSGSYQLGSSGTYIMQIYSNDHSPNEPYWYNMYWSAIISWYKGTGNQAISYPITLQRAGHSDNNRVLEAQITNTDSSGSPANELRLELKTTSTASSTDISIRFRRLL